MAPEPRAHSKVSMDTNPHYEPSSGESISTQPPGELAPEPEDQTCLVTSSQEECEVWCTGIHPSNPVLQAFYMGRPEAIQQDSTLPQKATLMFRATHKLRLGKPPWPHEVPLHEGAFMDTNSSLSQRLLLSLSSDAGDLHSPSAEWACRGLCTKPNPSLCFQTSVSHSWPTSPPDWEFWGHNKALCLPTRRKSLPMGLPRNPK